MDSGDDFEELRLALVLNGGVSLAVWIGGATYEVDRLLRSNVHSHPAASAKQAPSRVYRELLALTRTRALVDIISGTSAGGINGALLAFAITRGASLESLRTLWIEKGSFAALLRDPFVADPPSLLKGDDYFLPELEEAFDTLARAGGADNKAPMHLTLTTTLLTAEPKSFVDDLGQVLRDSTHQGRLTFSRMGGADLFADRKVLARAARATASFPIAFEPHAVRVGDPLLPHASFKRRNFLLDGGILDNKPLRSALDAMFKRPRRGDVRRVLAYVVPDPVGPTTDDIEDAATALGEAAIPSLIEVALASLHGIPAFQSISDQIDRIREHNKSVLRTRSGRLALIRTLQLDDAELVARLFPAYRLRRLSGAVDYVLDQVGLDRVGASAADAPGTSSSSIPVAFGLSVTARQWLRVAIVRKLDVENFVPPNWQSGIDAASSRTWNWGLYVVEYFLDIALELLRATQRLVDLDDRMRRERLVVLWDIAYEQVNAVTGRRRENAKRWYEVGAGIEKAIASEREKPLADRRPDVLVIQENVVQAVKEFDADVLETAASIEATIVGEVAQVILHVAQLALGLVEGLADEDDGAQDRVPFERGSEAVEELLVQATYFGDVGSDTQAVLRRLLTLEVVEFSVRDHDPTPEAAVELVQVTAEGASPLGGGASVQSKLTGSRLAHFAAFYKKSWRASDWMQGRLDGGRKLLLILLNPKRLERIFRNRSTNACAQSASAEAVLAQIERIATERDVDARVWSDGDLSLTRAAQAYFDGHREAMQAELRYLSDATLPIPESLPACANVLAYRLHLEEIIPSELPEIRHCVDADEREGAGVASAVNAFADRYDSAVEGATKPSADRWAALFRESAVIGTETVASDAGSTMFSNLIAHSAVVASAAGGGRGSGLGRLLSRPITFIRAPLVGVYLMTRAQRNGSNSGVITAMAVLAACATLLILGVFLSAGVPDWLFLLASGATLSAVVFLLLRGSGNLKKNLIGVAVVSVYLVFVALLFVPYAGLIAPDFVGQLNGIGRAVTRILALIGLVLLIGTPWRQR